MKHIILLFFALVWVTPVWAEDVQDVIDRAFRETEESTRRVRERQQYIWDMQREQDRRREEFNRNYDRNNGWEWKYNTDTDKYWWEHKDGLIIEGD